MINLQSNEIDILKTILNKVGIKFYAFGSRVHGTNRKLSDLDLCYKESLDKKTLIQVKHELTESNLPFFVDLVDCESCDESFKKLLDKDLEYFCG
jgi:predicted nucleotidyltransferase